MTETILLRELTVLSLEVGPIVRSHDSWNSLLAEYLLG